nr:aminotransferase class I/II-fold pyridoxal phosphate-dependent enzyme [Bacillus mesophilus]
MADLFKNSSYQIGGHGTRNIDVLKMAFQDVEGKLESDLYGTGQVIEDFQKKMAAFLGKENAVFFPSGTMAQQIALRIWCDQKGVKRVAYHPLSHLEIHEEDGLKELHQIESVLLADQDRVVELEDIEALKKDVSCILLELPQREIGGQLPSYETLVNISNYCKSKDIKLHLDGARLLEVLPYYKVSAKEICSLFDSVYLSFYKGIGGIAGAILAGSHEFTQESKTWKRRYGGDLISLYPYIISANYNFDKRATEMNRYYTGAIELAELFNSCTRITTRPLQPVSNMFHVHFQASKEKMETILKELYKESDIGMTGNLREVNNKEAYFEVSIGDQYEVIPKEKLKKMFELLELKMHQI